MTRLRTAFRNLTIAALKLPRRWIFLSAFLFFIPACLAYAYFYESRALRTVRYDVTSENLPPAFDGFKIVFITDVHHQCWMSFNLLPEVLRLAREEKPDAILFGGDYAAWTEGSIQEVFAELKKLEAPYGKFGVLGNHDYYPSPEYSEQMMRETGGIQSLSDRGVWLEKDGARIRLFGTEYLWDEDYPLQAPRYELERLTPEDFVLLLVHNPDDFMRFPRRDRWKVDVALCGHTHGGQVTFFGIYTPISVVNHQDLQSGQVHWGNTSIITSNGVGTVKFPLRFFAPPQIVTVTLHAAHDEQANP